MSIHQLKTWPEYYQAVKAGDKTFEVRKNDRDFKTGDLLYLMEWDNVNNVYTGDELVLRVSYVLQGGRFGVEEGFVVLGLRLVS